MTTQLTPSPRGQLADQIWVELTSRLPAANLDRIRGMLDVWTGQRDPELAPGQRCLLDVFMPGVPSSPWYDAADFACTSLLEEHYDELRAELDLALARGLQWRPYGQPPGSEPLPIGRAPAGWKEIRLCWGTQRVGVNCEQLPRAAAVMDDVLAESHLVAHFVYLALEAGARIPPHTDPLNALTACHLAMSVPTGCGLRVGGEWRAWDEGRCLAFDNSYPHEAWNGHPTDTRIVLAVHVPHPDLSAAERQALAWLTERLLAADRP